MRLGKMTLLVLLVVVALAVLPLLIVKTGDFGGSDDKAEGAISQIAPDYKPWFGSLIRLPSGEVESLLFSLQAALGAGVIGFGIAYLKYNKGNKNDKKGPNADDH